MKIRPIEWRRRAHKSAQRARGRWDATTTSLGRSGGGVIDAQPGKNGAKPAWNSERRQGRRFAARATCWVGDTIGSGLDFAPWLFAKRLQPPISCNWLAASKAWWSARWSWPIDRFKWNFATTGRQVFRARETIGYRCACDFFSKHTLFIDLLFFE